MVESEPHSGTWSKQIHQGSRYSVFRVRDASGRTRIVKTVRRGARVSGSAELLAHEHAMLVRAAALPGLSRVISFDDADRDQPRLILEDAGPRDLKASTRRGPLSIDDFLRIATDLTDIVAGIHRAHIIHRDINPSNVVIGAERRITLVDFDLATHVQGRSRRDASDADLEGTLLYVAPEQTGRLDRIVDHRADLYALGATFYEMLTGAPPFALRDPVELVHAHLARDPVPPTEVRAEIPRVLSDLVLKLLAKAPEDRYQSADALAADLREAGARWETSRAIDPFELARLDVTRTVVPEGRIYGRDRELAVLEAALDRAREDGRETVMIAGAAGIGKTALGHRLRTQVTTRGGHFAAGKLDPLAGNAPYAPLIEALGGLLRDLMAGPAGTIDEWRARAAQALGANARVITDVVPDAHALLGAPPPLEPIAATDAETRFDLTFEAFVQALATSDAPLVLFLDDLQWADAGTLRVVERLATSPSLEHVLLVGAFRSDEVGADHPLAQTLAAIRTHGATLRSMVLCPLQRPALTALCEDAFHATRDRARELAGIVQEKTAGNPFHLEQFLRDLQHRGLIAFEPARGEWTWSVDRIADAPLAENVVELMLGAIRRLPANTQRVLGAASCFRREIELDLLARLIERPVDETAEALWSALDEGLLVPERLSDASGGKEAGAGRGAAYRFSHDRVAQAMTSLLEDEERRRLHLRLGRLLGESASARGELDERLFDRVDHLNLGRALLDRPGRLELAQLNLRAGRSAKASSAFGPALAYLSCGLELLPESAWRSHADLSFALHRDAAEAAYVVGDHGRAEALVEQAILHAPSRREKAALYSLRVLAADARRAYCEAIRWGGEGLRLFGIELPPESELERAVDREVAAVAATRGTRTDADLAEAPPMQDADALACAQLLDELAAPSFFARWRLHVWIRARTVRLMLDHGPIAAAGITYATYGKALGDRGDHGAAHAYVRLGAAMSARSRTQEPRALTLFAVFMNHWRAPLRTSVPMLRRAITASSDVGDSGYAARTRAVLSGVLYAQGTQLSRVMGEVEAADAFCRRIRQQAGTEWLGLQRQMIRCLQGLTRERGAWDDDDFDEAQLRAAFAESPHHQCVYQIMRLETSFLLGDLHDARARMETASACWEMVSGLFISAQHVFLSCLTRAALADVQPEDRDRRLAEIERDRERLARWAQNCPPNFAHKHDLVAAEVARLSARHLEATQHYEAAIAGARHEGFEQDEALANELAGRYYRSLGQRRIAAFYLEAAMDAYARWGASAKVEALEEEIRDVGESGVASVNVTMTPPSDAVGKSALDRLSLVEAAETISSEVSFEGVVGELMRVGLAAAGAQRGVLVLEQSGALQVRAVGTVSEAPTIEAAPLRQSGRAPISIVEHAFRTAEPLVLANAAHHVRFGADPYVMARGTRSVLAVPIQRQAHPIGVLYLENDLVTRAFGSDRVQVLRVLSSQIAISLENSRLFEDLRLEVRERARAERRLRFLSEASVALARSLDWNEVVSSVARVAVPFLADWCTLDVRGADGIVSRAAQTHVDPSREGLLRELDEHAPGSLAPAAVALRTGEPQLRERSAEGSLEGAGALDTRSVIAVPLWALDHVIGVLSLGSTSPAREYRAADLSLAQELARRAAIAMENARLYRETDEAVRLRDEFLSIASHELRTPLAGLQLAVQALPRMSASQSHADAERVSKLVMRQVHRLDTLIGLLLDVSKLRRGRLQLDRRPVDLRDVVRDAAGLLAEEIARSRSEVVVRADAPVIGCWDGARLEQVVINLLGNAIKFGRGRRIDVSVTEDRGVARLVVADQGIGIPPEVQPHVFEPFRRGVSSQHYGGLGLGLFVTKTIIDEHGGRLELASEPGHGTTFTVELPLPA